ncbi:MAG TPA: redoxin domain-containing protein [Candidatus Handelsmanbacteria bacterium]|nr:redoxin domain-containing protein [Candidatus Handelsmanbacteria bacterium]
MHKIIPIILLLALLSCRADRPKALDLDGYPVDPFTSDAQATVLLFVQTDCPISNRYAPTIAALHERFAPQGAEFWLVYPDPNETPAVIRHHREEYGLPGQVARDTQHVLARRVGASITPETVVLGPHGNVLYRGRIDDRYTALDKARPQASKQDLADALTAALAGQSPDPSVTRAIGCFISDLQ